MDSQLAAIQQRINGGCMTKKQQREQEKQEAISRLRELLPPGSTVFTILRHCSRSGMQRAISPVIDNEDISYLVACATGDTIDQRWGGIKISGAGMDMGYSIIYHLSRVLYPSGYGCIGEDRENHKFCPSNDHSNGDRDYTPHSQDKPHHHRDGGYALKHRWL